MEQKIKLISAPGCGTTFQTKLRILIPQKNSNAESKVGLLKVALVKLVKFIYTRFGTGIMTRTLFTLPLEFYLLVKLSFHIYYNFFSSFLLSLMQVEKLQKTLVFIIKNCNFSHVLYLQQFSTESNASREASKDFSIYNQEL